MKGGRIVKATKNFKMRPVDHVMGQNRRISLCTRRTDHTHIGRIIPLQCPDTD